MIWISIIVLIVFLDQLTKYVVIKKIDYGKMIPIIDDFFYLTYHENKGAAWGMLKNARYFLIAVTLIVSVVLFKYLYKIDNILFKISLSFILGGAFGNLIDRVVKGSVADFLDFYFWGYSFPTFNVADMFITIGSGLLFYYLIFIYQGK